MQQIVPGIYWLEGLRGCNVYLLISDEELTLLDCGFPGDAEKIIAQLQESGFQLSDLNRIVLTHCHGDHVGAAAKLARLSGAQIIAHQFEVPYIEQKETLPIASIFKKGLHWLSNRLFFRFPHFKVNKSVKDSEMIDESGTMQVIHSPGHTPGSMSIFLPERKILFCGDALFNVNPLTGKKGLRLPISLFTADVMQARESAKKLSELPIDMLCCGHGKPVFNASDKIRVLL